MRVIIAGGRDFVPSKTQTEWLLAFLVTIRPSEVISGGCSGADRFGENVANSCETPIKRFPADWTKYGKAAGPKRNEEMATYAAEDGHNGVCILFPGGRGTDDMRRRAKAHGLKVIEWQEMDTHQ